MEDQNHKADVAVPTVTAESLSEAAQTFIISDPFCATKGGDIVARGFKTAVNAQKWLDKKIAADPDGYAGCYVEPDYRR
jgi:hypothetical protein